MNVKPMKNEKGFTLIELLISMGIASILLGAAMYTYTKQDKVLRTENIQIKLRDYARLAMDKLQGDIRMAGYGFPPGDINDLVNQPSRGVTNANATTLTYRANTENISTFVNYDFPSTADGLLVISNAGFSVGDQVVFFDTLRPKNWKAAVLTTVTTATVVLTHGKFVWSGDPNGFDANPIADNVAVVVNKYHTFTYTFDSVNQVITLADDNGTSDGGTDDTVTTVASNISNLSFRYFSSTGAELTAALVTDSTDATALGSLRGIEITLSTADDIHTDITTTLVSATQLRNMGI